MEAEGGENGDETRPDKTATRNDLRFDFEVDRVFCSGLQCCLQLDL